MLVASAFVFGFVFGIGFPVVGPIIFAYICGNYFNLTFTEIMGILLPLLLIQIITGLILDNNKTEVN